MLARHWGGRADRHRQGASRQRALAPEDPVRLVSPGYATPAAVAAADAAAPGRLRPVHALLAALAGGLALAAAFPPVGIWPLAALGPALLAIALWQQRARTALCAGLVFGLAFFFPLLTWLINVAWYVWTALAVAESLVFAVLCLGQWLLLRLRLWPLAVAGWWVSAEAVRSRWPYAFPWGRLAMSQSAAPTAKWSAVGGPVFLTFLVALTGACLAWLVMSGRRGAAAVVTEPVVTEPGARPGLPGWILPALALVACAGLTVGGALVPADGWGPGGRGHTAVVAAIQGDVPHTRNLPDLLRATTVTENHAAATRRLAAAVRQGALPAPDVVIWPENSTDEDPRFDPYIFNVISGAVTSIGRPVLVGAVLEDPERNTGALWLPGRGPVAYYVKRQLVPFGEYIPMRGLLDTITSLPSLQPVNFTPGRRAVVFDIGKIRLGDVICYEIGFDGLVSSEVASGANLLTMQTNDADFELDGQTGETTQQLAMARMRAIEYDRSVVVASTTGVSAIIAPDGALIAHTSTWQQAEIEASVPLLTTSTLALRLGGWPEAVITVATALALLLAAGQALGRRRRVLASTASPAGPAGQASSAGPVSQAAE
jgi:apolipoprotein N-acyltransferase